MKTLPLSSIRARMTAAFSLVLALLLVSACAGLIWRAQRAAERSTEQLLKAAARKVHRALIDRNRDAELSELVADERDLSRATIAIMIVDPRGHVVEKSQNRVPAWPLRPNDNWRAVTLPYDTNTVVVALPWRTTKKALQAQAEGLILLSLIVLLCAGVGAWLLVGWTLLPISRLAQQAQAASADDLCVRLAAPSHDAEIVELVTTLNGLLTRLAESAASRGRFYAAASHELRTPLQALSGHLELALTRPRSAKEYHSVLREAQAQTRRLMSLARDLLLLNQLESGQTPPRGPMNLIEVCDRALCYFAPLAQECQLCIETDWPVFATIQATPTHAEMLVRNLIENAVKYATPGGQVRIHVASLPEGTHFEVFNTYSGADWDPQKLFEPFYRPDASRNVCTGGNGLGLAICKAIATANDWQLSLQKESDGIRATVLFPDHPLNQDA